MNAGLGTSPGQPGSAVNLTTTNTTCAGNVATTVVPAETTTAAKGSIAFQGKPQVEFAPAAGTAYSIIQVRAKTPTREFVVATGALPTDLRRVTVSTGKCLSCRNGSLYQHGGNRVDNVQLCVACHNPASSEKSTRVTMGNQDSGAAPWSNQIDDVLMGPAAATCMSCHQSGVAVEQLFLRGHAYTNGISPATFPNGRQSLIDAAVLPWGTASRLDLGQ